MVILLSAEKEADAHPLVVIPVRVDDVQNRYDELIGFVVLAFRMEGGSAASMSFSDRLNFWPFCLGLVTIHIRS